MSRSGPALGCRLVAGGAAPMARYQRVSRSRLRPVHVFGGGFRTGH
jgi:hypothetical protein